MTKKASVIRLPDAKDKSAAKQRQRGAPQKNTSLLPGGLVPGRLLALRETFVEVEMFGGETVEATPAEELDATFLSECLRLRRTVLVTQTASGVVLLGALQTTSYVPSNATESAVRTQRFVVDASEGLVLRVGQTELSLDPKGVIRFAGEKMSVAVSKVFRVLSANAELP